MINAVQVTNYLGEELIMDLRNPEESGFLITSITGIGPADADINVTEIATDDGSIYNSARTNTRNIVLTIKFLWKSTIEQARHLSYKYFPVKKPLTLTFYTDERTCEIDGYVESNEPDIFSNWETTKISVLCPYPYFYSVGEGGITNTIFSGIESTFEFEFENNSLEEDLIEFGEIYSLVQNTVYYEGDTDIGCIMTIEASGAASNISIYNTTNRDSMTINTDKLASITGSEHLQAGDRMVINTMKGNKSITLFRGSEVYNALACLDKDADWLQLTRGDNLFAYTAESGFENLDFFIENRVIYQGV